MVETKYTIIEAEKQLKAERTFNAPVDLVWRAWTHPVILDEWWAPKPFKARTLHMDFTVGGYWLYAMDGPIEHTPYSKAEFLAIEPLKSYTGLDSFTDETGKAIDGMPKMHWQVTFEANGDTTNVTVVTTFEKMEDLQKIVEMGFKEGFAAAHGNLDDWFTANL